MPTPASQLTFNVTELLESSPVAETEAGGGTLEGGTLEGTDSGGKVFQDGTIIYRRSAEVSAMSGNGIQVCSVCGVKIQKMIGGDRVLFSTGSPGTRDTLWAKVCQHTDKAGCINKDRGGSGTPERQNDDSSEL